MLNGNLLTLPVGGGLLYVQPVFVQASSGTQLPTLQKVLVAFGDEIAFEDTLDEALDVLFGGDSGATPVTPTSSPTRADARRRRRRRPTRTDARPSPPADRRVPGRARRRRSRRCSIARPRSRPAT